HVEQIVDCHDLNVTTSDSSAENHTTDTAEAIDTDFDHFFFPFLALRVSRNTGQLRTTLGRERSQSTGASERTCLPPTERPSPTMPAKAFPNRDVMRPRTKEISN